MRPLRGAQAWSPKAYAITEIDQLHDDYAKAVADLTGVKSSQPDTLSRARFRVYELAQKISAHNERNTA